MKEGGEARSTDFESHPELVHKDATQCYLHERRGTTQAAMRGLQQRRRQWETKALARS